MKLHEYQAREILAKHGVPVPQGNVARTGAEARTLAEGMGGKVVVKAQIHAGGRGKGGGVKLANTADEAERAAGQIIGMDLITPQTGPQGQKVKSVLVAEQIAIEKEFYLSVIVDSAIGWPVIIASQAGGMDIEEVAAKTPEKIIRVPLDPATGYQPHHGRLVAEALGLSGDQSKQALAVVAGTVKAFFASDASLVEVNPLVVTTDGRVLALDAKLTLDDNALFRHADLAALRDKDEEDPLEVEAGDLGISNFVKLEGNIGCVVNGAGLAMSTMDVIKYAGGEPANFLDIGTVNDPQRVVSSFKVILADPAVKAILINIFGGMARTDVIAQGVVEAMRTLEMKHPVVVRLAGTNLEEGLRILRESGLPIITADDLGEAARKAVEAANKAA